LPRKRAAPSRALAYCNDDLLVLDGESIGLLLRFHGLRWSIRDFFPRDKDNKRSSAP
jgi:hypothetical protein